MPRHLAARTSRMILLVAALVVGLPAVVSAQDAPCEPVLVTHAPTESTGATTAVAITAQARDLDVGEGWINVAWAAFEGVELTALTFLGIDGSVRTELDPPLTGAAVDVLELRFCGTADPALLPDPDEEGTEPEEEGAGGDGDGAGGDPDPESGDTVVIDPPAPTPPGGGDEAAGPSAPAPAPRPAPAPAPGPAPAPVRPSPDPPDDAAAGSEEPDDAVEVEDDDTTTTVDDEDDERTVTGALRSDEDDLAAGDANGEPDREVEVLGVQLEQPEPATGLGLPLLLTVLGLGVAGVAGTALFWSRRGGW